MFPKQLKERKRTHNNGIIMNAIRINRAARLSMINTKTAEDKQVMKTDPIVFSTTAVQFHKWI